MASYCSLPTYYLNSYRTASSKSRSLDSLIRALWALTSRRASLSSLPLATWGLLLVRTYLILAVVYFLSPLWHPKDDMSDINLTPLQRQLLSLGPSSAPPTPGSAYSTPPRYPRSTPQSSGSRAAIFGSSPFDRS